jgi:hypothetical protein
MALRRFGQNDVFFNILKTKPYAKFSIYNGDIFYKADFSETVPQGYAGINDTTLNSTEYYRFFVKTTPFDVPSNVSTDNFNTAEYGDVFKQNYPFTSSIAVNFYPDLNNPSASQYTGYDTERRKIKTLEPLFYKYKKYSDSFKYKTEYVDFDTSSVCLISIPSVFYGSSISKGSVKLNIYKDGILLSQAEDVKRNGELVITTNTGTVDGDPPTTDIAGVVLYDEGLIVLYNTSELDSYTERFYNTEGLTSPDYPRWINWGLAGNLTTGSVLTSSYSIEFNGVERIPQLTMLAHAPRGELNYSTNYTFLKTEEHDKVRFTTSSVSISENKELLIKNITKNPYVSPTASFHKETYITKINIYDEEKNLLGVANLATPVRKNEQREFTFKLKLDL